jgi:hypothetical protein
MFILYNKKNSAQSSSCKCSSCAGKSRNKDLPVAIPDFPLMILTEPRPPAQNGNLLTTDSRHCAIDPKISTIVGIDHSYVRDVIISALQSSTLPL